ncbi:hypothetical protein GQR58_014320 [Nymphon striatum]|nr:hypothetical protein GQR58_014320 [Nymphon striatum]
MEMEMEWKWNGNGMEMEWKWNGNGMEMEWKWNGNGMEMEWKWNGNGMEMEWKWNGNGMEMEITIGIPIEFFRRGWSVFEWIKFDRSWDEKSADKEDWRYIAVAQHVQGNRNALEKAKRVLDKKYTTVGISENYKMTLFVLEKLIPGYFNGVISFYNDRNEVVRATSMTSRSVSFPTTTTG